ncbi:MULTISPECIES: hypothetical protein [Streptomyces violaceusniger group]|uniref:Bacterial transcriptional activator domain-containing protein n=2 Tax=Streptomyces rhizosphaericus TaxID=114699 RepID=A0ABP3ZXR9_9ACTN|nr:MULTISPECIES: hypothetical protein [Streptomyces violaceusniger group]
MVQRVHHRQLRQFYRAARALLAALLLLTLAVGIPWGLVRFVGWPLPDHLTTWTEIQDLLLAPLSTSFLLNTLACLLWPTWAVFVLDVVRTTLDMVRTTAWPEIRPAGLVHALATALVGTVVLALATSRSAPQSVPAQATTVVDRITTPTGLPVLTQAVSSQAAETQSAVPGRAVVRPPHDGVYDSLWRIAERELGDGRLWSNIYALNEGRPQPDGHALTTPGLIRPGWILHLPDTRRHSLPGHDDHPTPGSPEPPPTPRATVPKSPSTQPAPSTPHTSSHAPDDPAHHTGPGTGISLPTGAFVSLGLAALITAAWLSVRWRRRMRYRPGSGEREDLTVAPVVRALRLANDQAHLSSGTDAETPDVTAGALADQTNGTALLGRSALAALPRPERLIAVKDGRALGLDLARTQGLGLVGPGALDALRALVVTLLAEGGDLQSAPDILIPFHDVHLLVGEHGNSPLRLSRLHIVDNLDAALDTLESELLTRARQDADTATNTPNAKELVLVATPAPHAQRRMQAILDNGSSLGLSGLLIGQWRPGATAHVRTDGTVAATSASLANFLADARLFTLPPPDSQALLSLLSEADPSPREAPAIAAPSTRDSSRDGTSSASSEEHSPSSLEPTDRRTSSSESNPQSIDSAEPFDTPAPPASVFAPSDAFSTPDTHTRQPALPESAAGTSDPSGARPPQANLRSPAERQPHRPRPAPGITPADSALRINLLGNLQVVHHRGDEHQDITSALAPRQREILAFLALHPNGARRETLTAALWPNAPADRPYNALHATLSQLRRALRTATHQALAEVILRQDGPYALDRDRVSVDLWELHDVLDATGPGHANEHRLAAVERLGNLYRGDLAEDLTAEWAEAPREALRRDVLDAFGALAHTIDDTDPEQALILLEHARTLDRYNETLYQDIARLQAHLGQRDAVVRTLALLTSTLAQLGERPSQETVSLCELLLRCAPPSDYLRGRAN